MRYFALLDGRDDSLVRNVIIVNRAADRLDVALFGHSDRRWVRRMQAVRYLFGPDSDQAPEISVADAAALVAHWGTTLPTAEEMRNLGEAGEHTL